MKSALMLITLASWTTGQLIIYPDEFESMIASTPRPQQAQQAQQSVGLSLNSAIENLVGNGFSVLASPPSQSAPGRNTPLYSPPNSQLQANDIISRGVFKFALDMDKTVVNARARLAPGSRENIVFSPLSVAATLSLVLLGSAGRTFDELSTILGLNEGLNISRNSEAVHRRFGALVSSINGQPGLTATETSLANGIFIRDGYPIRSEFKAASRNIYNSEVINLDYQNGRGNAEKTINTWVNEKTRGKIPTILNGPPPMETNVIIASALYFNGEWKQHFIEGSTRNKLFTVAPGETVTVDMMYNGGDFSFFEDKQLRTKIVALPYKGEEMTMYVVLPTDKGADALSSLKSRLDVDTLENLIRNMKTESCVIGLPRMKLSSTLSLRDTLQSLGLISLFNPATADLSLISGGYTGAQLTGRDQNLNKPTSQRPSTDFNFPSRFPETVDENGNNNNNNNNNNHNINNNNNHQRLRQNFFSYDDKVRGYHIEQWATGFTIGRIPRQRRRRGVNLRKSQVRRSAELMDQETGKKVAVEGFGRKEGKVLRENLQRVRRQSAQQINQDLLNIIDNQNQPSYGIDDLRTKTALTNPGIFADDVFHRVEMDVNEKGTVAAAATSVILTKDGSQKRLVAERPFLFFIRHEPTGLILFWGTVNKPTPSYPSPTTKR